MMAATVGLAGSARAQYKINEDDGIAASPRVRQFLNERKATRSAAARKEEPNTIVRAGYRAVWKDGIAASPRVRQMMNERQTVPNEPMNSSDLASAGYQATGPDGITASPKVREQLNQRRPTVIMVAPVK